MLHAGTAQRHALHQRQTRARGALAQADQPVAAAARGVPTLKRRCGRTEHDRQAATRRQRDRQVAGRVARTLLLLEGRVVLLVDHHRHQRRQRDQHGKPGAKHDPGAPLGSRQPVRCPFGVGHVAVQDGERQHWKSLADALRELGRQGDLRHQHQRLRGLIACQQCRKPAEINLGFATAGDAVQQEDRMPGTGLYLTERLGLARS